ETELLRWVGGRIDFAQGVVHVRAGLNGHILPNLLRKRVAGPGAQQDYRPNQPFAVSHTIPPVTVRVSGHPVSNDGMACILVPCGAPGKQNSSCDSPIRRCPALTLSRILREDEGFARGKRMDLGLTGRVAIVAAASKVLGRAVA